MHHTSTRDKNDHLDQRSPMTAPPSDFHQSCLTAALQDANDANNSLGQLGPAGHVVNWTGWGADNNQVHSAVASHVEVSNLALDHHPSDPVTNGGLASSIEPRFDQSPASSGSDNAPWNPYRAFSAPEIDFASSWDHYDGGHEALQPEITGADAARSFDGSWSASYLQSPITPFQSASSANANIPPLPCDDFLLMPSDNDNDPLAGQSHRTQRLDQSRSSSFSKGTQPRSWLNPPFSSHQSIGEENFQNGIEISMEGIDFDETAATVPNEEARRSDQSDCSNLLRGLRSPLQQERAPRYEGFAFGSSQEPTAWWLNDAVAVGSLEGITEPFPELLQTDLKFDENVYNGVPFSASSDRFQDDLPSSYPPTSHHWPPYHGYEGSSSVAAEQIATQPCGSNLSPAPSVAGVAMLPALPIRNKSNKSKSLGVSRRSRRSSVNDGKKSVALTRVPSGLRRGVRDGQLPHAKALEIAQKRENKSVCIACKSARVKCDHNPPDAPSCDKCLKLNATCTRADFAEFTDGQTCNPIFQRRCMHVTLDGCRRVIVPYSPIIDADWLYSQLVAHQTRCNIQVASVVGAVWEIDIQKCYELLSKLPWKGGTRRLALDDFFRARRMSATAWLDCVRAGNVDTDFDQFLKYTNMPSHNTYSFLSLRAHEKSRRMGADDPRDRQSILMAAQLCRIITRALEIKGFRDLQKELGEFTRLDATDIEAALVRTGQLLGTLRWRLALWELMYKEDVEVALSNQVKKITHVLYSWFLFAKRRLPGEQQSNLLQGCWSTYIDVPTIWDDFPQDESSECFQKWLRTQHTQIEAIYNLPQETAGQASLPALQMPLAPPENAHYDSPSGPNFQF